MLSVTEFVNSIGNFFQSLAELYQYEALILGTVINCKLVYDWGTKKRGK